MLEFLKSKWKIILFIAPLLIFTLYNQYISWEEDKVLKGVKEVSYSTFREALDKGEIKEAYGVSFSNQTKFHYKTKDGQLFLTDDPQQLTLREDILLKNVTIKKSLVQEKLSFIFLFKFYFYMVVIFLIFNSLKSGPFNNSIGDLVKKKSGNEKVELNDVIGIEEITEDISLVINILKDPKKFKEKGIIVPNGLMFYGPPGTGKTTLAKAISNTANLPFYAYNSSEFHAPFVGLAASKVRKVFALAKKNSPSVLFLDEIDSIGRKRGGEKENGGDREVLNALLQELSGFGDNSGVFVIGATNRLEDLDPALIRAGRFDKHIEVRLPNEQARIDILKKYTANKTISNEVDYIQISKWTHNFSGADLENLVNETAMISFQKEKEIIDMTDFDDALFKNLTKGYKKRDSEVLSKDRELVAWHEAGHALINILEDFRIVSKLSIIPSTAGTGGYCLSYPKNPLFPSKRELLSEIKGLYGGRSAERLLTRDDSEITVGAASDIEEATKKIINLLTTYGMGDQFGPINSTVFVSENDMELRNEASKIAKELYEETYNILLQHQETLKCIANELLLKGELDGDELLKLISDKGTGIEKAYELAI